MNKGHSLKKLRAKLMTIPFLVVVAIAAFPAIAAAIEWDGIDPVVNLGNGHTLSVHVEWEKLYTCSLEKDLAIGVSLPSIYRDAKLVSESAQDFKCPDGTTNTVQTRTKVELQNALVDSALVTAKVAAKGNFAARVHTSIDGVEVAVADGKSNQVFGSLVPLP